MNFFIKTFGCQMNVHDSQRINEILTEAGHRPVETAAAADLILVNSCTVREKPWHKAISETGRFRKLKAQTRGREVLLGVVGCVAQQEGERVFDLLDGVDFVVSPDNYAKLPAVITSVVADHAHVAITGFDTGSSADFLGVSRVPSSKVSAFVTIMKGCNEHCRYCIVPSVRGPERHRDADEIENEVRFLVSNGVREIVLLGQKVNAYSRGPVEFSDLIRRLDAIDGLERLRFTSPHPRHMTDALIELYAECGTLCDAIHLPVQSGSNGVLKRMGRRYTREGYLEIVSKLRNHMPAMAISTDFIVGYPGETDDEFEETLALIEDAGLCGAYSFKYSSRPGTSAASLTDDVSDAVKSERLSRLHDRVRHGEQVFRDALLNRSVEVLVDGEGRQSRQLSGRTRNNQIVNFQCTKPLSQMLGCVLDVRVVRIHPNSLEAEMILA